MMFNKTFIKTICITLMVTFLAISAGRVTCAYGLADPVIPPELAPVFDTEIINLQDYVADNLSSSQGDVFNILLGFYLASQAGFSEYKLTDPYTTHDGILGWLKSCGLQLYNSLVGMGAIGVDPLTGIDYRPYIKGAADIAMGCAVKASEYTDVADFVSDVDVQEKYLIPFMPDIQSALNYIFSQSNGLYNWQFTQSEFEPTFSFNSVVIPPASDYWNIYASLTPPPVRGNLSISSITNAIFSSAFYSTYTNVLFNPVSHTYEFYSDSGLTATNTFNIPSTYQITNRFLYINSGTTNVTNVVLTFLTCGYYDSNFDSYPDIVQNFIDTHVFFDNDDTQIFLTDFVQHFYYGTSWSNKTEIFHSTDLNLDPNSLPYYQQIGNNYLLDIKGILGDLLNQTDLTNVVLNHLYDLHGVIVTDPELIRVTTQILDIIQTENVPLPVNLNDIADYTDNTYLEKVKENARNFGDIFANYIFFWHNCDSDLVYVCFGAGILVLIAAFIGKWGHS